MSRLKNMPAVLFFTRDEGIEIEEEKKLRKHKKLYILHSKIKVLITYEIYIHVAARNFKMTLFVPLNLPHQVVVFIYYAFFLYYVTPSTIPLTVGSIYDIYITKPQKIF